MLEKMKVWVSLSALTQGAAVEHDLHSPPLLSVLAGLRTTRGRRITLRDGRPAFLVRAICELARRNSSEGIAGWMCAVVCAWVRFCAFRLFGVHASLSGTATVPPDKRFAAFISRFASLAILSRSRDSFEAGIDFPVLFRSAFGGVMSQRRTNETQSGRHRCLRASVSQLCTRWRRRHLAGVLCVFPLPAY